MIKMFEGGLRASWVTTFAFSGADHSILTRLIYGACVGCHPFTACSDDEASGVLLKLDAAAWLNDVRLLISTAVVITRTLVREVCHQLDHPKTKGGKLLLEKAVSWPVRRGAGVQK